MTGASTTGFGEAFVAAIGARAEIDGPRLALAAAARSLSAWCGTSLDEGSLRLFADRPTAPAAESPVIPDLGARSDGRAPRDSASVAAGLLGACLEAVLTGQQRLAGAHHTPPWVAERVVGLAFDSEPTEAGPEPEGGSGVDPPSVCDPAVGGGVFLLEAADRLHRAGLARSAVLDRLWGYDIDPVAVAVTETVLALWAGEPLPHAVPHLAVGDFLEPQVGPIGPPRGWSVIVGNPPFQSQLAGRTARDRDRADHLRERFGSAAGGYVDTAGLFVLAAVEHLAPRGRLAMVLPASMSAAADAACLRETVTVLAPIRSVWVPGHQVFEASVDVVVPVFERRVPSVASGSTAALRGGVDAPVTIRVGGRDGGVETAESWTVPHPGSAWSALLADAEGVPRVHLDREVGLLSELAQVTAGFRQHFYGLADAVSDGDPTDGRPLVTVGLVDPLTSHWGIRRTRLAGAHYERPVVDPTMVDDLDVRDWVAARERPKVLVATQTRVVEAVVDPVGAVVPSTPLISVEPHEPEIDLWAVAAVLCAPPVTAWLHRRGAGGGLSVGRIRPTAKLIAAIPLPSDGVVWALGAEQCRAASAEPDPIRRRRLLEKVGSTMTQAYGFGSDVTAWWERLLPSTRPRNDQTAGG